MLAEIEATTDAVRLLENAPVLIIEKTPFEIDAKLSQALPKPSEVEREELKRQIEKDGIKQPYTVWEETGKLLDGHTREEIRQELKSTGNIIPLPQINYVSLADHIDAITWMFAHQKGRRNWSKKSRAIAVYQNPELLEWIKTLNNERQKAGKKLAEGVQALHTDDFIAELAGVSTGTVWNARQAVKDIAEINQAAEDIDDPELREKIEDIVDQFRSDDPANSLNAKQTKMKIKTAKEHGQREIDRNNAVNEPPPLVPTEQVGKIDVILEGDNVEALKTVASDSVALCITSMPYAFPELVYEHNDSNFVDYRTWLDRLSPLVAELFRTTRRVFLNFDSTNNRERKDTTRQNAYKQHAVYADIVHMMRDHGYHFGWEICWYKQNSVGDRPNVGTHLSPSCPNICRQHEYILGFHKGPARIEGDETKVDITADEYDKYTMSHWYIKPVQRLKRDNPHFHPCPFPEEIPYRIIKLFTYIGDTIIDPYNGSGTTTFVAKALGRRFIGIDNGPSYVAGARARMATLDGLTPLEMRAKIKRHELFAETICPKCKTELRERADGYGLKSL